MAALQHVRCPTTICSALRQILSLPTRNFSLSLILHGKNRKRESRVATRFARIEPPESRSNKKPATALENEQPVACRALPFNSDLVNSMLQEMENDLPLSDMPDPFVKDYPRCFMCTNDVKVDYKNVRLLSQFVSPYTGRIYGRPITGLCIPMQKYVAAMIIKSRATGFMPIMNKDPRYLQDPQPFNPMAKRM